MWSALGTVTLMMALFMLEAVICFFIVQSTEAVNILTYGGRQTCHYPLDVYPEWIRLLFSFVVPVALCLQFPVCRVLGRPLGGVVPGDWVWLTPLAGPLCYALMSLFWRAGLRRYRSTGS